MTRILQISHTTHQCKKEVAQKVFFLSKTTVKSNFISSKNIYSNKNEIKIFSREGKL